MKQGLACRAMLTAVPLAAALVGTGALPEVGAASAGSGPWVVAAIPGKMHAKVAGFNRDAAPPSLRSLIRKWGRPAQLRPMTSAGCKGTWRRPRVTVDLYNFASPGRECTPKGGLIQVITTVGPRWRTNKGLRIGARVAAIRARHPNAIRARPDHHGAGFLLEPFYNAMLGGQDSPIVAQVRNGKVIRFRMWIGGAGE